MKFTHLQGLGSVPALEVKNLEIGDIVLWNYGGASKVTGFGAGTKCFRDVELEQIEDGLKYTRRLKKDRLVGVRMEIDAPQIAEETLREFMLDTFEQGDEFTFARAITNFHNHPLFTHIKRAFRELVSKGWLVEVENKAKFPLGSKYTLAVHAVRYNVGNLQQDELKNLITYALDNRCKVRVCDGASQNFVDCTSYTEALESIKAAVEPSLNIHKYGGARIGRVTLLGKDKIHALSDCEWFDEWQQQFTQNAE